MLFATGLFFRYQYHYLGLWSPLAIAQILGVNRFGSNGLWFLPSPAFVSRRCQTRQMFMLSDSQHCIRRSVLFLFVSVSHQHVSAVKPCICFYVFDWLNTVINNFMLGLTVLLCTVVCSAAFINILVYLLKLNNLLEKYSVVFIEEGLHCKHQWPITSGFDDAIISTRYLVW